MLGECNKLMGLLYDKSLFRNYSTSVDLVFHLPWVIASDGFSFLGIYSFDCQSFCVTLIFHYCSLSIKDISQWLICQVIHFLENKHEHGRVIKNLHVLLKFHRITINFLIYESHKFLFSCQAMCYREI